MRNRIPLDLLNFCLSSSGTQDGGYSILQPDAQHRAAMLTTSRVSVESNRRYSAVIEETVSQPLLGLQEKHEGNEFDNNLILHTVVNSCGH